MTQQKATLTMLLSGWATIATTGLCIAHRSAWCLGVALSSGLWGYAFAHYK